MASKNVKSYLTDYLTGKQVVATPEEYNRQEMLRRLHEDYGYPKELMVTEYGVKKSPSDTRRSVPVDIAVFECDEDKRLKKPKIFVETKKPNCKEGQGQLHDYMSFEKQTVYGVWYNGTVDDKEPIAFFKKEFVDGGPVFNRIQNIPYHGYADLSGRKERAKLRQTYNLTSIFKELRGYIAANDTGTTRDERILLQLVMIILAKLYDEKYKEGEFTEFHVVENDGKKTKKRIEELLEEARVRWKNVFDDSDKITLDDRTLIMVVGQLQDFSLEKSPKNVISEAFESIISYATKGSQGQFFTPKNIVDLMVTIADPTEEKTVFDPACGTAGFLISAMYHVWEKISKNRIAEAAQNDLMQVYAGNNLFGIEKDSFLAKIAKAYMAVLKDGRTGIFIEDALSEATWKTDTKSKIENKQFDYILTNPPFGKEVKLDSETKKNYLYGDSVELAFVEQSLKHLADGGILGIILPETVFHAPSFKNVREELFYKHNITHLIDLPHDTFRPYNNAKTDIIFLQKNKPQQKTVTVIRVLEIGHDHLGNEKKRLDKKTLQFTSDTADDIPTIINDLRSGYSLSEHIKTISSKEIIAEDLLVARPYFTLHSSAKNHITLGELIKRNIVKAFDGHGSPAAHYKGLGEYPYVRVKDIVNMEIAHNRLDDIPESEYKRLRGKDDIKKLEVNDIVFVRRGSYRIGDVGIVYEKDLSSVLTREILVLRVLENNLGITPFNLLGILNSKEVRQQLNDLVLLDTTLPNIGERWKKLHFDISNSTELKKLSIKIENMVNLRTAYWKDYISEFGKNG